MIHKVFIRSFGCQMNARDSEVLAGLLKQAGFALCEAPDKADVVILNTCSVRQHAEEKVWSEIGRIAKAARNKRKTRGQAPSGSVPIIAQAPSGTVPFKGPSGTVPIIGLIGCMAQNYQQGVFERSEDVDFVVGPADLAKIPGILEKLIKARKAGLQSDMFGLKIWETDGQNRPEEIYHTGFYEDKDHAFVVISEGCSNFCSYCVVPYVRGPVKHRRSQDILKEIKQAVEKGITRVTLLGQNVNSYKSSGQGRAQAVDFVRLLTKINAIPDLKEIGFITSHPKDTTAELFKAMAECKKVRKYLHLPVQSGSDAILKAMNRGYTRQWYLDLVNEYRQIVKGGMLSTDIIVGFPGETEKDFQQTYDLVKEVGFDSAYIFKYSPRPNTAAARLADDVLKEEKERRHALILGSQKKISMHKRTLK